MIAYIESIGVFDKSGNLHNVKFNPGLNIITGRSSTGKSALINIFDYCMGKSQNTIPRGVISENANIYFVVLKLEKGALVLARKQAQSSKAFIKPESRISKDFQITEEYFSEEYFLPLKAFIEELGQYMGLDLADIDESKVYGSKKGRPSVRNMISLLLQPQNLIANNQGLFYRFDDSDRKERVIQEFKIFMRLVDQRYYIILQELEGLKKKKREIESKIINIETQLELSAEELNVLRESYEFITGVPLFGADKSIASLDIIKNSKLYLEYIKVSEEEIILDEDSIVYKAKYDELQFEKNQILGERRSLEIKRSDIRSTINSIERYSKQIEELTPEKEAYNITHECPFCHSKSTSTLSAANALLEAINWLNQELKEAPLLLKTYLPQLKIIDDRIKEITFQLNRTNENISHIKAIAEALKKNNSLEKQANTVLVQVQYLLSAVKELDISIYENELNEVNTKIKDLESELNSNYNIDNKVKEFETFIDRSMNRLAENLSFEQAYRPINLHFDIKKFELFCYLNGDKVYLSSMGSAANWLYSHLCLFLSLIKLFCKYCENCIIPPILFIDQPSQVYFPTMTRDDTHNKFNAEDLSKQANEALEEVRNMFVRILDFIEETKKEYGIAPQIILTEHADGLNLGTYNFEKYVVKRWRNRNEGLISNLGV